MPHAPGSLGHLMEAIGGVHRMAALLNVSAASVYAMVATNRPPQRHHCALLQLAIAANHDWRPLGWDRRIQLRIAPHAIAGVLDAGKLMAEAERD